MSLNNFLLSLLPLYMMVLIGFFARKVKVLNKHANQVMTQIMLYITLPSLIIFSLNINVTPDLLLDFVWLIFLSIFHLMISIVLARLSVKRSKLSEGQKSVYESLIIFGNQGFLGLALSYTLYGHQGIVFLTLFNICYLLLIWTYGIYLFTRNSYILQ